MSKKDYKKTVAIEIDFEQPVCPWLVPAVVSNRDAVNLLGSNIKEIRLLEETANEK